MQIKKETVVGFFILISTAAFIYMIYTIGFFRFDKINYARFFANFDNIAGLSKKADVKIAGVKVGWVDALDLSSDGSSVRAKLYISKKHNLRSDAQLYIRQDNVLGAKFIEVIPGTYPQPRLSSDSTIATEKRESASLDTLFDSVSRVTKNLEAITLAIKETLTSSETHGQFRKTIAQFGQVTDRITALTMTLDQFIKNNDKKLDTTIVNLNQKLDDVKSQVSNLISNLSKTTVKVNEEFMPNLNQSLNKITKSIEDVSQQFNKGVNSVTQNTEKAIEDFSKTTESIRKVTGNIESVTEQFSKGEGVVSKITSFAQSPKVISAINTAQTCVERISNVTFGVDNNYQYLFKNDNSRFCQNGFKSMLNLWVNPDERWSFIGGFTFSKEGFARRFKIIEDTEFCFRKTHKRHCIFSNTELAKIKRDSFAFNLQAAYFFDYLALRVGLFESTPGVAVDLISPTYRDRFLWVSSFEAFDFSGKNSIFNRKPYLNWFNRLYFNPNLYLAFGVDNFANDCKRKGFIGLGLNFGYTYF